MKLTDFDAVLFDLDGTLYREDDALPGAAAAIARLQRDGIAYASVTNAGAKTHEQISDRLASMGIDMPPQRIYSAGRAMADLILQRWPTPRVVNFAGAALPVFLDGRATWVTSRDEPCDAVAITSHMRENNLPFDFEIALVGLHHLRRGASLVVGCCDRVFPIEGGGVEFGSGAWGQLFAFAAGLPDDRLHYAGKPEPGFFRSLLERLGVDARRCLMVGDNLDSDIRGAAGVGMSTALVLTGIATREDAGRAAVQPDAVYDDLPALLDAMG